MAGIFGQTQVAGMDTPVQPIAPVTNESAVEAARGIGNIAQTGLGIFADIQTTKKEAAINTLLNTYEGKQMELADAVSSGKMDRADAELEWRANYKEFRIANPKYTPQLREINKFLADTTGFGNQVFEKSDAEQNKAKQIAKASEAGWVRSGMTKAEQELATEEYFDFEVTGQKMARESAIMDIKSKEIGLDKGKLELFQAQRRETSIQNVSTLASKYTPNFNRQMSDIVSRLNNGQIDQKQAVLEIQGKWAEITSVTSQIGKDAGGEYVTDLLKPMSDLKGLTESLVTGKIDLETFNSQKELAVAKQQFLISKDPELVKVVALDSLLKNSDVLTYSGMTAGVVRYLGNGSNVETKPFDGTPDTPQEKKDLGTALTIVKQNMSALGNGRATDPERSQEQVEAFVYNTLKGVDAYKDSVQSPSDYNEIVSFLTSPEFSQWTKSNPLPADVANNAKMVFQEQYDYVVEEAVKKEWEQTKLNLYNQFSPQAITGKQKTVETPELIEPYWNGSGVAFKLKDGVRSTVYSNTALKRLNDKPAKLLNRLIRLDGNLSGKTNYKSIYEQRAQRLFGINKEEDKMKE